jgi:hypothetical protein
MECDLYPLRTLCGASDKASDKACALHLWVCAHYVHNYLLNTEEYNRFLYCTVAIYVMTAIDKIDTLTGAIHI